MLFSETFRIDTESLPELHAYDLQINRNSESIHSVGGKLAYRLKSQFGGHWVWDRATWRVIGDLPITELQIAHTLTGLWADQDETFHGLQNIVFDQDWSAMADSLAQWVAFGFLPIFRSSVMSALSQFNKKIGNVLVSREYDVKPWVVDGHPAVSVSIKSNTIFTQDLKTVLAQQADFDPIGLFVSDKFGTLKGEIVDVSGPLGDHRKRLLSLAKREASQKAIAKAPDDELVLAVRPGFSRNSYEYIASMLDISLRTRDFGRFNVNGSQVLSAMRLSPAERSNIVRSAVDVLNQSGLHLTSYRQSDGCFRVESGYAERGLVFGNEKLTPYNQRSLYRTFKDQGLYRVHSAFINDPTLRIGFLDFVLDKSSIYQFMRRLQNDLQPMGFEPKTVEILNPNPTRDAIERSVNELVANGADIIIGFLPDDTDEEDEQGLYTLIKSTTVRDGVPSQMVQHSTLTDEYAVGNIVLGIVSKTGNIPFVLGRPLEYADILIGIDIARNKRRNLAGTINVAATARIYQNDGEFLGYSIADAPVEGETLFRETLEALLPIKDFENKRVVVHRDGPFRGDEKRVLEAWGSRINAQFYPVEVLKSGAPRIYKRHEKETVQPDKGSTFYLGSDQAIVISSLPPFPNATPQPLHIRSDVLPIRQAVDSVLSLTLLHYGSIRAPRLPVTLHYSDKIAGMLLAGIRPSKLDGQIPYWL